MIPQWYCKNCDKDFGHIGTYYLDEDGYHCPLCDCLVMPIEEKEAVA